MVSAPSLTLGSLGVRDRTMHVGVKPLDILLTEAADAGRKLHRVDQPRLFPPAKRVLVDTEPPCGFTDSEQGHSGILLVIVESVKF